jgi:hypothetical protein
MLMIALEELRGGKSIDRPQVQPQGKLRTFEGVVNFHLFFHFFDNFEYIVCAMCSEYIWSHLA